MKRQTTEETTINQSAVIASRLTIMTSNDLFTSQQMTSTIETEQRKQRNDPPSTNEERNDQTKV